MPFQFFKLTENRGIVLVILAIAWPFVFWLLMTSELPRYYFPFFNVIRHHVAFLLTIGVLGSILASTYCTLARPISTQTKWLCFCSVIIAIVVLTVFSTLTILNQSAPFIGISSIILGYIAVLLNIYVTSTELSKRYLTQEIQADRNDTVHAWAAFLFSIDLILIVGFFTWIIYILIRM